MTNYCGGGSISAAMSKLARQLDINSAVMADINRVNKQAQVTTSGDTSFEQQFFSQPRQSQYSSQHHYYQQSDVQPLDGLPLHPERFVTGSLKQLTGNDEVSFLTLQQQKQEQQKQQGHKQQSAFNEEQWFIDKAFSYAIRHQQNQLSREPDEGLKPLLTEVEVNLLRSRVTADFGFNVDWLLWSRGLSHERCVDDMISDQLRQRLASAINYQHYLPAMSQLQMKLSFRSSVFLGL